VNGRAPKKPSRDERKQATRQEIIDAALRLLSDRGYSGLSLREVTREAGISPGAFYRHFESMEALGLVLIDESFGSLRDMLRSGRAGKVDPNKITESSVDVLAKSVADHPLHWRFIARERSTGLSVLRYAINTEIRLITAELATDLARFADLKQWSTEDLNILAGLFVNSMVSIAEELEGASNKKELAQIKVTAEKQLRMIVVGMGGWRSS
jgi:AcrR family transcriptional regulator